MLWIGGAVVLVGGLIFWLNRRPRTFDYKGRRYTRRSDGGYVHADGSPVPPSELDEVRDHWESTHANSSSDSSDGGGDGDGGGGGGDGGGGGGGD
jgi:hypothetical protein